VEKAQPAKTTTTVRHDEEMIFPGPKKVAVIMVAVYLSMFLVALVCVYYSQFFPRLLTYLPYANENKDRTILGTAIPKITDEFHSITDVGWYASSYLLTSCAFQLVYGRIYTFYSPKWVLLGAIGLFEVGVSLIYLQSCRKRNTYMCVVCNLWGGSQL